MERDEPIFLQLALASKLMFYNGFFMYGRRQVEYAEVEGVVFDKAYKRPWVSLWLGRAVMDVRLEVRLRGGGVVRLRPWNGWFGGWRRRREECLADVERAAVAVMEATFWTRVERYERELREQGRLNYGGATFGADGMVRGWWFPAFNLRDPRWVLLLDEYGVRVRWRGAKGWRDSWQKIWRPEVWLATATDRDCFLYMMKHRMGLVWPDIVVPDMPQTDAKPPRAKAKGAPPPPPPPRKPEPKVDGRLIHLRVLGLDGSVDDFAVIKRTYRGLMKKHHPDMVRARGGSATAIATAEEKVKAVNGAFRWLREFYGE